MRVNRRQRSILFVASAVVALQIFFAREVVQY